MPPACNNHFFLLLEKNVCVCVCAHPFCHILTRVPACPEVGRE